MEAPVGIRDAGEDMLVLHSTGLSLAFASAFSRATRPHLLVCGDCSEQLLTHLRVTVAPHSMASDLTWPRSCPASRARRLHRVASHPLQQSTAHRHSEGNAPLCNSKGCCHRLHGQECSGPTALQSAETVHASRSRRTRCLTPHNPPLEAYTTLIYASLRTGQVGAVCLR